MKPCICCQITKPLSDYYKHPKMADGRLGKCKECVKIYQRLKPTNTAYEKERNQLPHRVKARKEYQKTDAGKAALARAKSKYIDSCPRKRRAVNAVNNAVRDNRLIKPSHCECCKKETVSRRLHGHHDDYRKELDVRWLCDSCHRDWHKKNGEGLNP